MVVYPFSDILFTLINDHLRPGIISASIALGTIWLNGRVALPDDCSFKSFGRNTLSRDGPVFGKFRHSLTKCDVALESIIIVCLRCFFFSCLHSIILIQLYVLFCGLVVFSAGIAPLAGGSGKKDYGFPSKNWNWNFRFWNSGILLTGDLV